MRGRFETKIHAFFFASVWLFVVVLYVNFSKKNHLILKKQPMKNI